MADSKRFGITASSKVSSGSNTPMKVLVASEPIKVLVPISFPSRKNAAAIKAVLIAMSILPGVNRVTDSKTTDIPEVPPSNSEWGKTKSNVLSA